MDIELLRTYLAVARTRHFGRAADELCVTQSAVSARIRQLEKALGTRLFNRARNNIQLTPEGRQLQKHAETIVHTWVRVRQETGLRETLSGGLVIGVMRDLWEIRLADALPRLREALPETALQIETGASDLLTRRLMDGIIDLALLFEPPQAPGLEIRECGIIRLVLVATQSDLALEQAFDTGYIMVDWGDAFAHEHARLFPEIPSPVLCMNHGDMARRFLQQAEGSAYLPEQVLQAGNCGRSLYRVRQAPVIERPVFAACRSGSDRIDLIRKVQELL